MNMELLALEGSLLGGLTVKDSYIGYKEFNNF